MSRGKEAACQGTAARCPNFRELMRGFTQVGFWGAEGGRGPISPACCTGY